MSSIKLTMEDCVIELQRICKNSVFRKFTTLCWASVMTVLDHMWSTDSRLDPAVVPKKRNYPGLRAYDTHLW